MSTLRTDTLSNTAGTKSVPVNTVVDGSAKAWVNFNGTGTVAIQQAFNVSSITDLGVGIYQVNLSTAMQDSNYAAITGVGNDTTGSSASFCADEYAAARTASSMRVYVRQLGGTSAQNLVDRDGVKVAIFR